MMERVAYLVYLSACEFSKKSEEANKIYLYVLFKELI